MPVIYTLNPCEVFGSPTFVEVIFIEALGQLNKVWELYSSKGKKALNQGELCLCDCPLPSGTATPIPSVKQLLRDKNKATNKCNTLASNSVAGTSPLLPLSEKPHWIVKKVVCNSHSNSPGLQKHKDVRYSTKYKHKDFIECCSIPQRSLITKFFHTTAI